MSFTCFSRPFGAGFLFLAALAASAQPSAPGAPDASPGRVREDAASWDHSQGDRVQLMGDNRVDADETVRGDVRAVMGSNAVEGAVTHDVVAVMGSDTINGSVGHDVVAVMGSVVINGTVGHNVKALMGNVTLGPGAIVKGDVVAAGGTIHRAPGALVRGRIISQPFGLRNRPGQPTVIWNHAPGQTDWQENFHNFLGAWHWVITLVFLGFYALLALLFPRAVRRCGDVLEHRPGVVVLVSLGALLAVPLFFILMLLTIIGIPVAIILLPIAIVVGMLVGKTGIYGLMGRSIGQRLSPVAAVLVGGGLCAALYFVPIAGFVFAFFLSLLGFGCSLAALLTLGEGRPLAPPPLVPVPPVPPAPANSPAAFAPPEPFRPAEPSSAGSLSAVPGPIPASVPAAAAVPADPILATTLPRAGFWIRMLALLIDSAIVSAVCGSLVTPSQAIHFSHVTLQGMNWMLPLAIYGALMWKMKGTTVGGLIFDLQVVRLDGRPVDWETAIVRALACFLSSVLCLGFIWIAFDAEKQAWHDKIAGTVVVRAKKAPRA